MLTRSNSRPILQIVVISAKHLGQVFLAAGIDDRQGVRKLVKGRFSLQPIAHHHGIHLYDLRRLADLRHGVERWPKDVHAISSMHAYFAGLGEDHASVTVTGTVTLTEGRAALVILTLVVPAATPVTRPVELTVATAVFADS